MDDVALRSWFDQYLATFAAGARGECDDVNEVLDYFAVPLLVTGDDAAHAFRTAEEVKGFARRQVERLRAVNYDHSETLDADVITLNATSALYRAAFARERADGSEIGRLGVTYLITNGSGGLRISALAVHTPS